MAESNKHNNNGAQKPNKEKSILETILVQNEPVTADTATLYEKAKENPDAFADLLTARVNQHLGFNTSRR